MDNLRSHHDRSVTPTCAPRGVRVIYQPAHSPDVNPIEPAGRFKSNLYENRHHEPRSRYDAWPAWRGTESRSDSSHRGMPLPALLP
jgi:hypothetical protein